MITPHNLAPAASRTLVIPQNRSTLPSARPRWKLILALMPLLILLGLLMTSLFYLVWKLEARGDEADAALIREWLDETRAFRKTLPELAWEIEQLARSGRTQELPSKRQELRDQLDAMTEPARLFLNQLPGFPIVYAIEIHWPAAMEQPAEVWRSPLPPPRGLTDVRLRELEYQPYPGPEESFRLTCRYQLHALDRYRKQEQELNQLRFAVAGVLLVSLLVAGSFVVRFLQRERQREREQLEQRAEQEHQERELLASRLQQQEAERAREELDRQLLQQQLAAAQLQRRADEAEKSSLQLRSQLFASIGIMAGSYAHNIKNLLVRPNDLLVRCLESDSLPAAQSAMLGEVRSTLSTVTERLQQILSTIRRDPSRQERQQFDLAELIQETLATWRELAADKWKVELSLRQPFPTRALVFGDRSHVQQALENLLFNARDAIFEERNARREAVRQDTRIPTESRKRQLIEVASWRGLIELSLQSLQAAYRLEVLDQGIGMTEEVRHNCLQTHFSTKRDNALYEGNAAGMGLGLSFVAVVLEHHQASLEVQSQPRQGTRFIIHFPRQPRLDETESSPQR